MQARPYFVSSSLSIPTWPRSRATSTSRRLSKGLGALVKDGVQRLWPNHALNLRGRPSGLTIDLLRVDFHSPAPQPQSIGTGLDRCITVLNAMIARRLLIGLGLVVALSRPALATPISFAPACTTGTLASYVALGGGPNGGCSNDPEVRFYDFSFTVLSSGGGAAPVSASDIVVTPSESAGANSLAFSSSGFSVTGSEFVTYLLAYTVDPHPIIRGMRNFMDTFTPVFPGVASITTDLCVGAAFGGTVVTPTCAGSTATLFLFHNGSSSQLSDETTFSEVADLGVRNTIDLQANGASADFTSFTNSTLLTPEPATWLLMASGLLAMRSARRRRLLR